MIDIADEAGLGIVRGYRPAFDSVKLAQIRIQNKPYQEGSQKKDGDSDGQDAVGFLPLLDFELAQAVIFHLHGQLVEY